VHSVLVFRINTFERGIHKDRFYSVSNFQIILLVTTHFKQNDFRSRSHLLEFCPFLYLDFVNLFLILTKYQRVTQVFNVGIKRRGRKPEWIDNEHWNDKPLAIYTIYHTIT